MQIINRKTIQALKGDGFTQWKRSSLKKTVSMDELCCKEFDIFNACLKWADEAYTNANEDSQPAQNLLNKLGDRLDLFRFPIMAEDEILDCSNGCSQILTKVTY